MGSPDPKEQAAAIMTVAKHQAGLTLEKAMKTGTQMSRLRRQNENDLLKAVCGLITFVCQTLNVGKNMTELQVYGFASSLVNTYWRLKLEEFILIFKNGCSGYYGKTYDRIDAEVLSGWIEAHLRSEDRISYLERAESERQQEEIAQINATRAAIDDARIADEAIQDLLKKFPRVRKHHTKPVPTNPLHNLEAWISDFREQIKVMSLSEVKQWEKEAQKAGNAEIISIVQDQLKQFNQAA